MILFKAQAASPPPCHITDKDFVTDGVSTKYSQFRKKKSHLPHWAWSPGKVLFCTHQHHWQGKMGLTCPKRQQVWGLPGWFKGWRKGWVISNLKLAQPPDIMLKPLTYRLGSTSTFKNLGNWAGVFRTLGPELWRLYKIEGREYNG